MITSEQLQQILTRISQGNERTEDLETLNETLLSGEKLTFQVGKNVVNIGKGEGIQIGDKHIYQGSDLKTIQESFRLELQKAFSLEPELSPIEVSEAICDFLKDVEKKFKDLKLFHVAQTVELEDQYVPIQVTLERRYQKHSEDFRSYAEAEEDTKRLYAMKGDLEKFERSQVDWQVAKKDHKQIMVLADPGMGKSTLLRMEAGKTAKEQREKLEELLALDIKKEEEILKVIDEVVLPIYLRLSDLAQESGTLHEIIPRLLKIYYLETGKKIEKVLIEKLKKGQCLLLFDALDEVPNDKGQRQNLKNKILNPFTQSYSCPIIGTSRIVGYGGLLDQAKEVEIVPFTTKQTEEYIEVWFKNAKKFLQNQEVSATSLINELKEKPQIQGLVQNPLLLSLVCSLAQTKDIQLPARRTQIYEQAVDKMLNKWGIENERPSLANDEEEPFKKIEQENLLRYIAYHFSCQQEVTEIFSKTDLLKVISEFSKKDNLSSDRCNQIFNELTNEHGIIQQLSDNRNEYLFLHRTFQEYLTASYINEKIKDNQEAGISLVKEHLWQFDWHETISLVAGLMTDRIPLLEAITQEKDDIFNTLLLLAGLCLSECPNIDHPLVTEIVDKIARFWQSYPKTGIETVLVTIGKIGNDKAVDALIKALDDSDDFFRSDAAEALGNIGNDKAVDALLIKALDDSYDFVRYCAAEALRKIGNDKAVDALNKALDDSDDSVRFLAARALGEIGNDKAVDALIKALDHSDDSVRFHAAKALVNIGNDKAVDPLIKALDDSNDSVRICVAEALGNIGNDKAVDALIKALDHSDDSVKYLAAEALARIGNDKAVDALIKALNHSDDITSSVAEALVKISNDKAVDPLINALDDSNDSVRICVAYALGNIGNDKAVDPLINALDDSNDSVRYLAAKALVKISNDKAVDPLIKALDDSNDDIRNDAAEALGKIGNDKAVQPLIKALDDSNTLVRRNAAKALGNISNDKAVDALIEALDDSDSVVGYISVEALGKIGNDKAVDALIKFKFLDDSDYSVRCNAAEALGEIGNDKAVDVLINALDDSVDSVRYNAVEALGKIGNDKAVDALINALDDSHYSVTRNAVEALGKIGNDKAINALINALDHSADSVKYQAAEALEKINSAEIVTKLLEKPDLDIYRSDIFLLARKLMVRHSQKLTHPLIKKSLPQPSEEITALSSTDTEQTQSQENISPSSDNSLTEKKDKQKKDKKKKDTKEKTKKKKDK